MNPFVRQLLCSWTSATLVLLGFLCRAADSFSSDDSFTSLTPSRCAGRRIYTLPLPSRFNLDLTFDESVEYDDVSEEFKHLARMKMNFGLGRLIPPVLGVEGLERAWYQTDPYSLESIFFARVRSHPCTVASHEDSDLVYVPYFGGHDFLRHMYRSEEERDRLGLELLEFMRSHPAWARSNGSDHFMVLGTTLWDFRRLDVGGWGTRLLNEQGVMENIWTFVVEAGLSHLSRVISVPFPTAFHPRSLAQLTSWQSFVQSSERKFLFSFVGGHRGTHSEQGVLREKLFWQCSDSENCALLDCSTADCYNVNSYFRSYLQSDFCLHPVGDSCTRRSLFDAALAGCIPVVFRECTFETQYHWHLGEKKEDMFVYINASDVRGSSSIDYSHWPELRHGSVGIEDRLKAIPGERIEAMRRRIIEALPKFIYAGWVDNGSIVPPDFKDGVDVMLEELAKHRGARLEIDTV